MHDAALPLLFHDDSPTEKAAARTVTMPAKPWARKQPKLAVDLSGQYLSLSQLHSSHRQTREITLETFRNAVLVWSDCFILDREFQCTYAGQGRNQAQGLANVIGSFAHEAAGISLLGDRLVLDQERLADPIRIEEPVLFATPDEPHNWGLWILNAVPAITHYLRNRDRYRKLFVYAGHPNMRRLLAFLGVDESELILHDCAATYRFAEVSLFRHSTRDLYVPPDHREVFTEIAARAARGSSLGPQSKVFVSRLSRSRQPGAERRLLNEEDLSVLLERLGFSTIEPDLLGPAEQIALFAGARQIVGLGGAGMFNGVFARSDAKLLDIESTAVFLDAHSNIFGSCGLEYGVMVGTEDASDCSAGHKRWTVDLRKAEPYIDFFFNA